MKDLDGTVKGEMDEAKIGTSNLAISVTLKKKKFWHPEPELFWSLIHLEIGDTIFIYSNQNT